MKTTHTHTCGSLLVMPCVKRGKKKKKQRKRKKSDKPKLCYQLLFSPLNSLYFCCCSFLTLNIIPKLPHAENSKTVHGFVKVIITKLISCHLVIMLTDWLVRTKD